MSKTLEELSALRASGVNIAPEAEIAAKRAARAEKKAKTAAEAEVKAVFPSHRETTELLWTLRNNVRKFRKDAVAKGVAKVNLPEEWKEVIYLAFAKLNQDVYRDVLWSLITECLKVQDREINAWLMILLISGFQKERLILAGFLVCYIGHTSHVMGGRFSVNMLRLWLQLAQLS